MKYHEMSDVRIWFLPVDIRLLAFVAIAGAGTTATLSIAFRADAYDFLPSFSPTLICVALSASFLALGLATPRHESLDLLAGRRLTLHRICLMLVNALLVLMLASVGALALGESAFAWPLFFSGFLLSTAAVAISIVTTRALAGVAVIVYAIACYAVSEGRRPWDLLFVEQSTSRYAVLLACCLIVQGVFIYEGAYVSPHDEES